MKTGALFLDAYRELNSKKLFWITMILSGFVVAIFGSIGLRQDGIGILWFSFPNEFVNSEVVDAGTFYKSMFTGFGVNFWLSIIATILALVTTAGMMPDFISGGSIELMLSKPISRLRLYLTKFGCGLLFVAMQVAVFSVASMLVIGIRGGVWEPSILLAIPIVVVFYSYLFSVCVLVGLITRSTLAALLLTILFWFILFLLNSTDSVVLTFSNEAENRVRQQTTRLVQQEQTLAELRSVRDSEGRIEQPADSQDGAESLSGFSGVILQELRMGHRIEDLDAGDIETRIALAEESIESTRQQLQRSERNASQIRMYHGLIVGVKTVLPKTAETIALLDRYLITGEAAEQRDERRRSSAERHHGDEPSFQSASLDAEREMRERSVAWVVGTSLLFEAFILAIGAWIFSRRDF